MLGHMLTLCLTFLRTDKLFCNGPATLDFKVNILCFKIQITSQNFKLKLLKLNIDTFSKNYTVVLLQWYYYSASLSDISDFILANMHNLVCSLYCTSSQSCDKIRKQYSIIKSLWHKLVIVLYSRYEPVNDKIKLKGGRGAERRDILQSFIFQFYVLFFHFLRKTFIFAGKDEERNCCCCLLFHKTCSKT